ncbi:MAG: hypothetical protein P4M15_01170 [Alphaproteobacteria bacterium]|nr:hypothetical protein [Alphaproteobacteria bacterium]
MKFSVFFLGCAVLALAGCTQLGAEVGTGAAMYLTKPSAPPPADTADQIPEHESWCYSTMGQPECFAHPQDVPPERLINVDPANRYPVDLEAYRALIAKKVVAQPETVVTVAPPPLPPPVIAKPLAKTPAAGKKAHHGKGKHVAAPHAHAKHKAGNHKAARKKTATSGVTIPLSTGPISLQPPAKPPVDMQAEKSDLKDEISKDDPGSASGDALPSADSKP